jgi:hypothetical protein
MAGRAAKDIVLTINTTASSAAMSQSGKFDLAWMSMTGLGLVGVVVIAVPRKRRKGSALLLALLMGSLVEVVSCGSGASHVSPDSCFNDLDRHREGHIRQRDAINNLHFTLTID